VPEHWGTVGTRHSPLSNAQRVAVTPVNAILNYLYAILEAEARVACLTVGLDPGLGIWHVDYRSRDSFALDLMEAGRPSVDRYVLNLIGDRTFTRREFGETSRGVCRVLPTLAQELAQTAALWRDAIAPHTEHVARLLAEAPTSRVDALSTPLTRRNRKDANPPKKAERTQRQAPAASTVCKRCAEPVPLRDRVYCDACLALPQRERRTPIGQATGPKPPSPHGSVPTSRRCKGCGYPVPHRKRIYCDECFTNFERRLIQMRRPCRKCGQPVPHRKRVYCDACVGPDGHRPRTPAPMKTSDG